MTEQMPARCAGDLRGVLTFAGLLPAGLRRGEDSTAEADARLHTPPLRIRAATDTERTLLRHLGVDLNGHPELQTHVTFRSPTLRRRDWPALHDRLAQLNLLETP